MFTNTGFKVFAMQRRCRSVEEVQNYAGETFCKATKTQMEKQMYWPS